MRPFTYIREPWVCNIEIFIKKIWSKRFSLQKNALGIPDIDSNNKQKINTIVSCGRFGRVKKPANRASMLLKRVEVFMCQWCVWLYYINMFVSDEPETRDAWWEEIRQEIKSHAKSLGCHAVVGYSESTSIWYLNTHTILNSWGSFHTLLLNGF